MRLVRDCRWALGAFLSAAALFAQAASFDCNQAASRIERTICASDQLSKLDSRLGGAFIAAISRSVSAVEVQREQQQWLVKTRNACPDEACLVQAYEERIAVLVGSPSKVETEVEDGRPQT